MRLLDEYRTAPRDATHPIDDFVVLDAPPSIVVSAIERYLDVCGNILDIVVPVGDRSKTQSLAVDAKIVVDRESHRNRAIIGRFDDRLEVFFSLVGTQRSFFRGRFTVRPLGVRTELQLKGYFTLPSGLHELASYDGAREPEITHDTIRALLGDLKPVIETEYQTLISAYTPLRRIDSPGALCCTATRRLDTGVTPADR